MISPSSRRMEATAWVLGMLRPTVRQGQASMQTRVPIHLPSPSPGQTQHLLNYVNSKDFVTSTHSILQEFIQVVLIIITPNLQRAKLRYRSLT